MMNKLLTLFTSAALICAQVPAWAEGDFKTLDQYKADGSSVVVTLSGKTQYHAFKISNPPRLVIEFSNTEFNAPYKEVAVNGPVITRIRGGQYQNLPVKLARVVVELTHMPEYELEGDGNKVRLILNEPAAAAESSEQEKPVESVLPAQTADAPLETAPTEVQVPTAADEEIQTVMEKAVEPEPIFTEPSIPAPVTVEVVRKESPVLPSLPAATAIAVPEPVIEPATPAVQTVAPVQVTPEKSPVPAAMTPPAVKVPPQQPAAATPAPKVAAEAPESDADRSYSLTTKLPRKPVTFDFEEADIRDVFRILSLKSGINIIYGPDVSGTLSLRLENVPFDKAFQTILSLKNLVSRDDGHNIMRIMTPKQVSEERAQAVTYSKVFPLNYAKADEIKANLDSMRTAEGRRGNIAVDLRTNCLIITDTPEGLLSMERMMVELDKKPDQVVIEAKIVEITLNKSTELGIQWQYAGNLKNDPSVDIGGTMADSGGSTFQYGPDGGPFVVKSDQGGTGVNFPATLLSSAGSTFSFGIIANGNRLNGILSALAEKGHTKVLSSPKVTTINNKEAKILVGDKVPYATQTVSPTGSTQETQFIDVGIRLTVTPTINADKKISLQVHPEVSTLKGISDAGPQIGTREALTTVIVNNGETAVIGGLITDDEQKSSASVPLMGDLPVIGHFFKHSSKKKVRTELLVFITPQIIE